MEIRAYTYKGSTIKLYLHGNWWSFSIDDDPCLDSFGDESAAKVVAEELIEAKVVAEELIEANGN